MKRFIFVVAALLTFANGNSFADENTYTEITWEDLIPADAVQPKEYSIEDLHNLDQIMAEEDANADIAGRQVVPSLAGKKVKLPAYVVPLEGDVDKSKEFLLVPYFGACIHVPPPPPNQIIFGTHKEGITNKQFDAVWAYGTLLIETVNSELAESGYSMKIDKVEILDLDQYDEEYR